MTWAADWAKGDEELSFSELIGMRLDVAHQYVSASIVELVRD